MKYGLIGERLPHSFSKEVHKEISELCELGYDYEISEIAREDLKKFMKRRKFRAINVTIPYKEAVIPYLHYISPEAKKIGAVNTVVKKGLRLYGYNTDFLGMSLLIEKMGLFLEGKKIVILGSGGTSKTARAVAEAKGAESIITVSRSGGEGLTTYDELYKDHADADILINTTPVGMFPSMDASPVELKHFNALSGVIDAIYNPIRTNLIIEAQRLGIPAEGGLYMLVAQAIYAAEFFFGIKAPEELFKKIYKKVLKSKQNIVLTGMPGCGKSTVAREITKALLREAIDTDELIVESEKKSIPEIFSEEGEDSFRRYESEQIANISLQNGITIATGGGAVLNYQNILNLKHNGIVYFIDRPLKDLLPTEDRPLALTKEAIESRYNERYETYLSTADARIEVKDEAREVARDIISDYFKRL